MEVRLSNLNLVRQVVLSILGHNLISQVLNQQISLFLLIYKLLINPSFPGTCDQFEPRLS